MNLVHVGVVRNTKSVVEIKTLIPNNVRADIYIKVYICPIYTINYKQNKVKTNLLNIFRVKILHKI